MVFCGKLVRMPYFLSGIISPEIYFYNPDQDLEWDDMLAIIIVQDLVGPTCIAWLNDTRWKFRVGLAGSHLEFQAGTLAKLVGSRLCHL